MDIKSIFSITLFCSLCNFRKKDNQVRCQSSLGKTVWALVIRIHQAEPLNKGDKIILPLFKIFFPSLTPNTAKIINCLGFSFLASWQDNKDHPYILASHLPSETNRHFLFKCLTTTIFYTLMCPYLRH